MVVVVAMENEVARVFAFDEPFDAMNRVQLAVHDQAAVDSWLAGAVVVPILGAIGLSLATKDKLEASDRRCPFRSTAAMAGSGQSEGGALTSSEHTRLLQANLRPVCRCPSRSHECVSKPSQSLWAPLEDSDDETLVTAAERHLIAVGVDSEANPHREFSVSGLAQPTCQHRDRTDRERDTTDEHVHGMP